MLWSTVVTLQRVSASGASSSPVTPMSSDLDSKLPTAGRLDLDDLVDVDEHLCRLLGPTALVSTDHLLEDEQP